MPYKFIFKINNDIHFQADMVSHQCECVKNNVQCKRKVVIGYTFCFQHLLQKKKLRIKQSTLGNFQGLFAQDSLRILNDDILFRRNDVITQYIGERIDNNVLVERYGIYTAPYAVKVNDNSVIDSALVRGVGSLANSGNRNTNNAKLEKYGNRIRIVATKNIRNGTEILLSYGNEYIMNEEGTEFRTKK